MRNVKLGEICYEFFTRDIFPDDECIDFMAENNLTINSVRYNACNYLASYGTGYELKKYDDAKIKHSIAGARNCNNIKGVYYSLGRFIINNYENDEKLKQEIFDKYSKQKVYDVIKK